MQPGQLFELDGRLMRVTNVTHDANGWLRSVLAICLQPRPGEAPWWAIDPVGVDFRPVTVH